jgi:hypothetical protein
MSAFHAAPGAARMQCIALDTQLWYSPALNLTLSDPMSDLVRHYDFPVPVAFLDL